MLSLKTKAIAVWFIEYTELSFEQIGDFCGIEILDVKRIADGEIAIGIAACNPISLGYISNDELFIATKNPNYKIMKNKKI